MSTGAKAGIGIGVTVGVLAFVLFAWAAYKYHKRRSAASSEGDKPSTAFHLLVSSPKSKDTKYHQGIQYHQELDGRQMPAEMAGENTHAFELDTRR